VKAIEPHNGNARAQWTHRPLAGRRILVCGKGGSGKSSLVTLLARALDDRGYQVLALDGDASNPGGLSRLMLGLSEPPEPLMDFFGGRGCVTCPVDDPSPLTRKDDRTPLTEKNIQLQEIDPHCIRDAHGVMLMQVGKINAPLEGCDGPMSKISRDLVVRGEAVMLIDVEAGIEHFGRGVERNVDMVIVVVDPSYESFSIAKRVAGFCDEMKKTPCRAILNKVSTAEIERQMRDALNERQVGILGVVHQDPLVARAGLTGDVLDSGAALEEIRGMLPRLEEATHEDRTTRGVA
jgi:CO dehydrogenase maturation factor